MKRYDAIVVGAGAGGGVAAALLAESGRKVLVLERGRRLGPADERLDHLRNQRLPLYGHNAGPGDGHPRVLVDAEGREQVLRPHQWGYHNNAAAVGGGTLVYGAQAWRFHPDDFRLASRYGVPKGSSLADWPIGYEDLAPFYERAEWELGVSGDAAAHRLLPSPARPLPMPPVPDDPQRLALSRAAKGLGWDCGPVPLLINTLPYLGRGACEGCGECIGFQCHVDAKNGTQNTVLPRTLATGNCELLTGAQASRIRVKGGRAVGVDYFREDESGVHADQAEAGLVILAAGAIESARLLLLSAHAGDPDGLGNAHGQLGRHLQGHTYAGALGAFDEPMSESRGPGVSVATCQFAHGNEGVIGGAMLANEFVPLPVIFWRGWRRPGSRRWGLEAKQAMRRDYLRTVQVQGPVQEIPSPDCRVRLDPQVKDKFGLSVARLSGQVHPETLRTARFMQEKAAQWLRAAGAKETWKSPLGSGLSAGQHQAGTCRMGLDPRRSVCDPWGKVHGYDGLHVADASLHVSNGAFNPVLTILANAFRIASRLASAPA